MSVCDVPVIAAVCTAVGDGTASLVTAPFDWLAYAMGSAAAELFNAVWSAFDTTTLVNIQDPGYIGVFNVLFGVAVFVTLIFFCLQLIAGLVRRDPGALPRAALGLGKSILGSFLVISLTGLLLEVTDQLAIGIVQATGNTMAGIGNRIALLVTGLAAVNIAAPGGGAILTIFLAGLAISAAAIVWFSLLIRKALLLVAIVFGPIALAGAVWDATKGWFPKWCAFILALSLSKLVLVVIFLVATAQVAAPINADLASISDPIAGIVLMFIAAFAPYITYKFLSFVGFDMYHAMSSEQEAKSSLNRPVPIPTAPLAASATKILGAAGRGAETTGGGTAAASGSASASGGAGAAGPIGAGIAAGATVVHEAANAGPKLGRSVARASDKPTDGRGAAASASAQRGIGDLHEAPTTAGAAHPIAASRPPVRIPDRQGEPRP